MVICLITLCHWWRPYSVSFFKRWQLLGWSKTSYILWRHKVRYVDHQISHSMLSLAALKKFIFLCCREYHCVWYATPCCVLRDVSEEYTASILRTMESSVSRNHCKVAEYSLSFTGEHSLYSAPRATCILLVAKNWLPRSRIPLEKPDAP